MTPYSNNWGASLLDQGAFDVGTNGPFVKVFRKKIAEFYNIDEGNIFLTNSGTSALELALQQEGCSHEYTCVLPAMTFVASQNVVFKTGAYAEYVDIRSKDLLMDLDAALRGNNKSRTIIMPTLLYGATYWNERDMHYLINYRNHARAMIFDSCEAFGSGLPLLNELEHSHTYHCISFNNNKILTTGAGGAIIASKKNIYEISIRNAQGSYVGVGENKGMASANAFIGFQAFHKNTFRYDYMRKQNIHDHYFQALCQYVTFQNQMHGNRWYTYVEMNEDARASVLRDFKIAGIPYRMPFQPLWETSNANKAWRHGLCLPSSPLLTRSHQDQVISIIQEKVKAYA